ncbi:MAG: hypothetical protein OEQ28_13405 [Acidobacteriota bacterium]|nr:hypothetical protein [Acidobacteriota bacterium]
MKKFVGTAFCVWMFAAFAGAQVGPPTRNPTATPTPTDRRITNANEITKRSNDLRLLEKFPGRSDYDRQVLNDSIRPIYRSSTDEELAAIAPTEAVTAANRSYVGAKAAGLIRLAADLGCVTADDVVSAKAECRKYSMPGAGSAYSFRVGDYRIQRLADINFRNDRFEALGVLTHGVLLYLGDVPVDSVSLESEPVIYLQKLKPAKDFAAAGAFADKLLKGFKNNDYVYASVMKALPGRTYVLRSIAYRGIVPKTIKGFAYNELEFDERRDITIVFRIVAMNSGEDVTLAWKELSNEKAPKLEEK